MQNSIVEIKEKRTGGCLEIFLISLLVFFAMIIGGVLTILGVKVGKRPYMVVPSEPGLISLISLDKT